MKKHLKSTIKKTKNVLIVFVIILALVVGYQNYPTLNQNVAYEAQAESREEVDDHIEKKTQNYRKTLILEKAKKDENARHAEEVRKIEAELEALRGEELSFQ